jgi:hypothetical protein
MTGPPTGFSHPRCYGQVLGDCSRDISREHWISEAVQKAIAELGKPLISEGMPWLHGVPLSHGINEQSPVPASQ